MGKSLYYFKDFEMKKDKDQLCIRTHFITDLNEHEYGLCYTNAYILQSVFINVGTEIPIIDFIYLPEEAPTREELLKTIVKPEDMVKACDKLLSDPKKYILPESLNLSSNTYDGLIDYIKYIRELSNQGYFFGIESE